MVEFEKNEETVEVRNILIKNAEIYLTLMSS